MDRSEQFNELVAALAKAQGEISGAAKGKENPFFKSKYADLACVMDACRVPLAKNGLAIIQSAQGSNGEKWVETVLAHASGQWVSSRYPIKLAKDDSQGMGSAVTYARRYSLMAMVGIVAEDEDDDGEAAVGRAPEKPGINPAPGRPKGDTDAKTKAIQWAKTAKETLEGFKRIEDVRAWDDKNQDALERLKLIDRDTHVNLTEVIGEAYRRLNTVGAG
jgi:hypothetical protein